MRTIPRLHGSAAEHNEEESSSVAGKGANIMWLPVERAEPPKILCESQGQTIGWIGQVISSKQSHIYFVNTNTFSPTVGSATLVYQQDCH